jgi:predicted DNA-binding transcriptional regulator YafY
MALVFSRDLLKPLDGTELKSSLDSAFNKMTAALPSDGASFVGSLRDFFSVGLGPHKKYREHKETIDCVTRAISRSRTVQMRYFSASRNATARRNVDPYRLWWGAGRALSHRLPHLRKDVRLFAVDRVRSIAMTNEPCQMPLGFDVEEWVKNALLVMRGAPIDVRLQFDRKSSRRWRQSRVSALMRARPHEAGFGLVPHQGAGHFRPHTGDWGERTGWFKRQPCPR